MATIYDSTHNDDDDLIEKMERKLKQIYSRAEKEINSEWSKFALSSSEELSTLQEAYDKASGDEKKKLGKELIAKKKEITFGNQHYQQTLDTVTDNLLRTNQIAVAYVNDQLPDVYARNYNFVATDISNQIGLTYSFALQNEYAVKNLATKDESLLPYKYVNGKKDVRWNTKKVNAEVLQGIVQGESIDKIATRLQNVTEMNLASAIRNARTTVTAAENKGRQDCFNQATKNGIVLQKVWSSAHDARVRAWHSDLNDVAVEYDEAFENDYGKIRFPGDPTAHPANVYNCRCSITGDVLGFRKADGHIEYVAGKTPAQKKIVKSQLAKNPNAKLKEHKRVTVNQLDDDLQKTLYEYSDGKYHDICDFSQAIANGDKLDKFDLSDKLKAQTMTLMNTIDNQPVSSTKLYRIQKFSDDVDYKVGNKINFGIRSATRDSNFVDDVWQNKVEGFYDWAEKYQHGGDFVEYRFINSKSMDISKISAYADQQEELISGTYRIVKVEEVEHITPYFYQDIPLSDVATNIEPFVSKSGKNMIRYTEDGIVKTKTEESFYKSTVVKSTGLTDSQLGRKVIYLEVD